jgi:tetratricopeptide (TPR) repeat protein
MIQKFYLLCFAIAFSSMAFGQYTDDSVANNRIVFLLNKFKSALLSSEEASEIKSLVYKIQNKGLFLGENNQDDAGALKEINKVMDIWIALRDTSNQANMHKFKGYLLGKLKKFPEAKYEIDRAVDLFSAKNQLFGVAVSFFDLSKVYEMEGLNDSAVSYVTKAIDYWKEKQDTFRLITNNNQLLNLYGKMKLYKQAEKIHQETEPLLAGKDLSWRPVIDFYFLSANLYKKMNQQKMTDKYSRLYEAEVASLKSRNIDAKPGYLTF